MNKGLNFVILLVIAGITGGVTYAAAQKRSTSLEYLHPEHQEQLKSLGETEYQRSRSFALLNETKKHVEAPEDGVRAIYMSSWIAGEEDLRENILDEIEGTDINAIVLDIKDDTGKLSYKPRNEELLEIGGWTERIPDIDDFIAQLHSQDLYVIGRVAVFQDNYLPRKRPDLAVMRKGTDRIWEDRKKLAWLDVSAQEVWEYVVDISEESYSRGFDEINLDYVRFPSDGQVSQAEFPHTGNLTRRSALKKFFTYMDEEIRFKRSIPLSADIFGMTTTNKDDLGIGQILEDITVHVDAVAPMVYPSHYPKGFGGHASPASVPYEIISKSMAPAITRLSLIGEPIEKLRPWIQDFSLGGVTYGEERVRDQIRALDDLGIDSYLVWDAANTYTWRAYRNN